MKDRFDILENEADIILYDSDSNKPRYQTCSQFRDKKGVLIGKAVDLENGGLCFLKLLKLGDRDSHTLCETEKDIYNNLAREGKFRFYYPYLEQVYGNIEVSLINEKGFKCGEYYGVSVEYVDGENLFEIWGKRLGAYDFRDVMDDYLEKQVFRHILQFLFGMRFYLNYASPGYLHRDIKPDNIMIDRKGNVKIIDYDVSHISGSMDTEKGNHISGFSRGYSSPNTVRQLPTIRDEFYAAGRLLFYWLNGKHYFTDKEMGWIEEEHRWIRNRWEIPYIQDSDIGYGTQQDRFRGRYQAKDYERLRSILNKMCSLPDVEGYVSIEEIIKDYIDFLERKYGSGYSKDLQFNELPLLCDEFQPVEHDGAPNVRFKVLQEGYSKTGKKLFQYGMRDYEINNAIVITLYNIGNDIYFFPTEGIRRIGEKTGKEDYMIHNGDTFETENGTKFRFYI